MTMSEYDLAIVRRYGELEGYFYPAACRSTTPIFSKRTFESQLAHPTDPDGVTYRTKFQHDRDKILYSLAFRRLRLKSQMFPEHLSGHVRTRLDHSLEVAQIARHMARQLRLNEDLADAIGLGHDLGHAPFAHSGERAIHRFLTTLNNAEDGLRLASGHGLIYDPAVKHSGFRHNWQSLRVVDKLERAYPDHDGLNLTWATRPKPSVV